LADELGKLAARSADRKLGTGVVRWAARKLPSDAFQTEIEVAAPPDAVLRRAFDVLHELGRIRDDVVHESEAPAVCAVVGSGFLRLNPALVTVEVSAQEEGRVRVLVSGVAKEGLIKQHAGEKAARRVAERLRADLPALDAA
jgi:hypothetical protein